MDDTSISSIKGRLISLPTEIKEQETALFNNEKELIEVREQKKVIERRIFAEVCNEVDAVTQKKVYSNAEMREAESVRRRYDDEEYRFYNKKEDEALDKKNSITREIDYLRREFKSIELLIELLRYER